ncbi:hypothetical protein RhiirC2_872135 [Rhizophagus irregularis]|uniref:DNA2/NAM7 helicase-like C-terminal domain-containing protein n=1 Tax=Rhizophagus irregularis TaxID=588596 RepID=A0A2N1M2X2_9GLOM|nr:hypothetical protein RhiirC2_872135 [Rhizophagus irregularis]
MHEVKMVVEMVKYFVKNGYTKYEDIAVLTPYSGQLIKIKDTLSKSFSVEFDERDAENIAYMEREKNNTSKPLNQQVTLRTVDNFQGEETKIVIILLVRNCSGNKFSSIRFFKSKKMGRPSRLSSDGDLLNVYNPTFWRVSVSASTFQFKSPTRAFGYAATGHKVKWMWTD